MLNQYSLFFIFALSLGSCGSESDNSAESEEYVHPDLADLSSDSVQWIKLEESQKVDEYFIHNKEVFCGEVAFNTYPLEGIDIKSFEVLSSTDYAKDKNHVYYPLQTVCVCGADWGNCHAVEYLVEGADPNTFEYLGSEYGKDSSKVFFRGKLLQDADPYYFYVEEGYGKDCTNTYLYGHQSKK